MAIGMKLKRDMFGIRLPGVHATRLELNLQGFNLGEAKLAVLGELIRLRLILETLSIASSIRDERRAQMLSATSKRHLRGSPLPQLCL